MRSELEQALIERLKSENPGTFLLIAPEIPAGLNTHLGNTPDVTLKHVVFESIGQSIAPLGRFDYVVVAETLDRLSREVSEQLISRLRDLHAKLLWVMVSGEQSERYGSSEAIAQGLRMVSAEKFGTGTSQWYEFSLEFYKPVPQWLNARDWANPDQWDKSRW